MRKFAIVLCSLAMLGMLAARTANAADLNLTFSGPVALPDVTLPGGSYIFRFVAPHVVEVLSADRKTTYAVEITIPTNRIEASEKVEVTFKEARADVPAPLQGWFSPGEYIGQELVYPKPSPKPVDR
jgi:hypothetical protein